MKKTLASQTPIADSAFHGGLSGVELMSDVSICSFNNGASYLRSVDCSFCTRKSLAKISLRFKVWGLRIKLRRIV